MARSPYITGEFWAATGERGFKSFVQGALAAATASGIGLIQDIEFAQVIGAGALTGVYSVCTSIISAKLGHSDSPSLGPEQLKIEP